MSGVKTKNQYLVYDETDDEEEKKDDHDQKETDYKRKIKRNNERHDQLKVMRLGMDKVFERLNKKASHGANQEDGELNDAD